MRGLREAVRLPPVVEVVVFELSDWAKRSRQCTERSMALSRWCGPEEFGFMIGIGQCN